MLTLLRTETLRLEIKKSRFAAIAGPVGSETEVRDFLQAHRDPTADHNCWAWKLGGTSRSSDDGEPGGTAGKPILAAIHGSGLDLVAVLVRRWFGGILLGGGGLVRAYGGTAAECLRMAEKQTIVPTSFIRARCGFADYESIRQRFSAMAAVRTRNAVFGIDGVDFDIEAPTEERSSIVAIVADITRGRAGLEDL